MEPGTVVRERYTIEALAGSGGMGSVYRAREPDGRPVALKVLSADQSHLEERFVREARMLMALRHPAIVRCLDAGTTAAGERYLVLEWLEGMDLRARLRRAPLALGEALALIARLAGGLGVAHARGMVHRDIKPANIFLPDGRVQEAKLLDFGVAHWAAARSLTATGMQIGTPAYMAPEQIRGERRVDARADVFSLGCVLYECLSGEAAFVGSQPMAVFYKVLLEEAPRISRVVSGVPGPVVALLERLLAKDRAARPRHGAEVAAAIERIEVAPTGEPTRLIRSRARTDDNAITTTEQHLVSVVVAAPDPRARGDQAIHHRGAHATDEESTLTLHTGEEPIFQAPGVHSLRQRYELLGARFDYLSDGSLIAVLDTRSTAAVRADDAAHLALRLREVLPGRALAVATGRVMVGQKQLLGEVIDRAVALLDKRASTPPQIRLDEVTAQLIEARFRLGRDDGAPTLAAEHRGTPESQVLGRPTPFVGRRSEMASLVATLDECIEETIARAVLVTGAAGLGKSRLCRELLRHISEHDEPIEVWQAGGDPMRAGSPLDLLGQAIRRLADIREGEPLALRQDKLRTRVTRSVAAGDADRVAAFIGELINTPWLDEHHVQLRAARRDARLMADQISRACQDVLAAEARAHPVVLVLEDLHWGDRATVSWLDLALRNLAALPIMVVAFARPEIHEHFADPWLRRNVLELQLRPLSDRVAEKLVRAVLGQALDATRVAQLVARADGNALYLEELMRSAAAGRWDVPETVRAMVQARLQALPPMARHVLRAASIFGERFWRGGVEALLGADISATAVDEALDMLVAEEIIAGADASRFTEEAEYKFRHDLMREAASSMLTEGDRELGHRLAGRWLQQAGEADAAVVAEHFERGGALEDALPCFLRAAEQTCKAADFEGAIGLAERGVACGAEGPTLGALRAVQAEALCWQGDYARAARYGEQAMELLSPGSRAWYDAARSLMAARVNLGEVHRVEAVARSIQGGCPPGHDAGGWYRLAGALSFLLLLDSRVATASALLGRLRSELGDMDGADPAVAARVVRARGLQAAIVDGNPAAAFQNLERAVDFWEKAGDLRRACEDRGNSGFCQVILGLYREAEATLRAVIAGAEQMRLDNTADAARHNLSLARAYQGELDEARELARTASASFEQRGNRRRATASRRYLALVLLLGGDMDSAEREARAALALSPEGSSLQCETQIVLARVLLARGRTALALELAARVKRIMQTLDGFLEEEALVHLVYAEALHASGEVEQARQAILVGRERLLERAAKIDRADWRRSFLENVPDHARTLELAKKAMEQTW